MADLNIDSFIQSLKTGGQRANLFNVSLKPSTGDIDGIEFKVKGTSLPGTTQGVIEVPYMGRTYKIPGDKTFNEWTVTVIDEEGLPIRKEIEKWSDEIQSYKENISANTDPSSFMTDGVINVIAKNGDIVGTYIIKGVWVSSLGEVSLSWDTNDSIVEYDITLQIQYFEKLK